MQETNGELNKSLSKLIVQNVQAAKDLNDAGERQRPLERQLQESSGGGIWKIAAIKAIHAFLVSLILRKGTINKSVKRLIISKYEKRYYHSPNIRSSILHRL